MELLAVLLLGLMQFTNLLQAASREKTFGLCGFTLSTQFPRAYIVSTLPPLAEFTLCHWFRPLAVSAGGNTIFDYTLSEKSNEIQSFLYNDNKEVRINIKDTQVKYVSDAPVTNITKWVHTCFTFSSYTGSINFYLDGQLKKNIIDLKSNQSTAGGGDVHLLENQQSKGSRTFFPGDEGQGEVAEVHLWDTVLCSSQIEELSNCSSELDGNVLNWKRMKMELFDGIEVRFIDDICEEKKCSG